MTPKVLIVDNRLDPPFGGDDLRRYLNLVPTEVRRAPDGDLPKDLSRYSHIVLSGSRMSCLSQDPWVKNLEQVIGTAIDCNIPLLGVCFGHQLIARAIGGIKILSKSQKPEFGWVPVAKTTGASVRPRGPFLNLHQHFHVFASHFEEVVQLPNELELVAANERCAVQAFQHKSKPVFGVQFHPERNVVEGERSIRNREKAEGVARDWIFNRGLGNKYFNESVSRSIFSGFLEIKS